MKQYDPKPAPRMGPKQVGTKTKDYTQTSFDIPFNVVDQLLAKSLKLEPQTNLQEAVHAAIRWFLGQRTSKTFPLFFNRYFVVGDLHSIQVPIVLTETLAEVNKNQSLKQTAENALNWFLQQPVEQTVKNFVPETTTIYLRGNMKEQIDQYIARLRAYAKEQTLECKVTVTSFVIAAMRSYYQEYLLKQTK